MAALSLSTDLLDHLSRLFGETGWAAVGLVQMEELFKFTKLSLEPHVGKDDRPSFGCKLECLLESHVFLLH